MTYSGFADEAGQDIETQIKATKDIGWSNIEARDIDGVNITDMSEEKFEEICGKLNDAKVNIHCFGSAVANSRKEVRNAEDVLYSREALKRAIPRMQILGTKIIRGMAFKQALDVIPDSPEIEKIIFDNISYMVKMCEDAGIIYLCENCSDYSALSYHHALRLVDKINSPAFKLIYDMGNTVGADNRIGNSPYAKQSAWEFYDNVKEFIYHVHIKDSFIDSESKAKIHTFPGEGSAEVKRIVADLIKRGYDGGFSIEPHMYNGSEGYVEYGRRFMNIIKEIKSK
ncbi:sugar phosphate isomerase/epimerase family protein [Clostridium lacusfryxellense]|uniref:sugar phosphate isomerase/epimerase family protein n=1 Tax=Clostridium lacusfryxellense TaxID=205328 RepID=UPI001C0BC7B0|nr:sugar phosphate isomerase/epimerase family protein [Clostridium lacusfryxellense]MBU3113262.1 sugar phosphate isomerase/epimerase [Clostridium lacusfryxellense]